MNPYIKPNRAVEVPSHAEIQTMLQRGRRLRAQAFAESGKRLVRALRGLIATGRDRSRETAEALASKPQGSLT
ncbi:MAG: hypothetical protein QNJ30_08350 [Kiloniellales bacterium]|nr:hypothetical protein [Kiloniellales bacterium]